LACSSFRFFLFYFSHVQLRVYDGFEQHSIMAIHLVDLFRREPVDGSKVMFYERLVS